MDFSFSFVLIALAWVLFICAVYYKAATALPAFAFSLTLLYSIGSKQLSVFYLDSTEVFISESSTTSSYSGASWRMLLYHLIVLGSILTSVAWFQRKEERFMVRTPQLWQADKGVVFWLCVVSGVLALQVVNVIVSGTVALPGTGITRYNFWTLSRMPILETVFGNLLGFVPFVLGVVWRCLTQSGSPMLKRWCMANLIVYVGYLIVSGQRFHGLIVTLILFVGPLIIGRVLQGKKAVSFPMILVFIAFMFALMVYAVVDFSYRGISTMTGGGDRALLYRIFVLQGHVMWNMDSLVGDSGVRGVLSDLFEGMRTTIALIMPQKLGEAYSEGSVNLATGLPATGLLVFGYWGCAILCCLYGLWQGFVYHLCYSWVRDGNLVAAFFGSYFALWTHGIYAGGTLASLIDIRYWIAFVIAIVLTVRGRNLQLRFWQNNQFDRPNFKPLESPAK